MTAPAAPPLDAAALQQSLSPERLSTYRQPGDDEAMVLARYVYNQALVDALGLPLQVLEVTLRNAIDAAGRRAAGQLAGHGGVPCWLDARPRVVDAAHAATTADAREMLRARGVKLTPGRLTAELSFGFWVQLFNAYYDQAAGYRRPGFRLWTADALRASFPNAPARFRSRDALRDRLEAIRVLRNRIAHHEPIFNRDPAARHFEVVSTLRWLSAPAAEYVAAFDAIATVIAAGPAHYLAKCRALLGTPQPPNVPQLPS